MDVITLILLIAGLICFLIAAVNPPSRIGLGWLGLACWITVPLIAAAQAT